MMPIRHSALIVLQAVITSEPILKTLAEANVAAARKLNMKAEKEEGIMRLSWRE
jgi:hypothetical protein